MTKPANSDYEPNSIDATLSRILANQEAADRKADAILAQATLTNGRVNRLETWREVITAKVVTLSSAIAGAVSFAAWLVERVAGK